ncbi:hypothetical protein N9L68_03640 [bacterium]|nr:hypothetical protein [bacterium]
MIHRQRRIGADGAGPDTGTGLGAGRVALTNGQTQRSQTITRQYSETRRRSDAYKTGGVGL